MTLTLNHLAVLCRDKKVSADFSTAVLGLPAPRPFGGFLAVDMGNGVSLDYMSLGPDADIAPQHYAFLVSEEQFDQTSAASKTAGRSSGPFLAIVTPVGSLGETEVAACTSMTPTSTR